jgi:hypothetical protein
MKIDGACHCGNLTYEAEVDPEKVIVCHCNDCQVLSGTVYRTIVPVEDKNFRLLSGKPKTYVKTAESGNRRPQTFCPECGSPLYATSEGEGPKVLNLRVGTIRQRDQLIPKKQIWTRSAQPWLGDLDKAPKVEKQ